MFLQLGDDESAQRAEIRQLLDDYYIICYGLHYRYAPLFERLFSNCLTHFLRDSDSDVDYAYFRDRLLDESLTNLSHYGFDARSCEFFTQGVRLLQLFVVGFEFFRERSISGRLEPQQLTSARTGSSL